jgi:hypothetical protein
MDLNMQEMYREMARWTPGGFVVERGGLVMVGAPHGTVVTNMAIVAGRTDVERVVEETERVYGRSGLPFSVHTRAHVDVELEAALAGGGFHEIATTPGMVFHAGTDVATATPSDLVVRRVEHDADRAAYADVMADAYAVYGSPEESTQAYFARMESVRGPTTCSYLGWIDGRARHRWRRMGGHAAERVQPRLRRRAHVARRRGRSSSRRTAAQPAGVADGRAGVPSHGLRDADPLPDVHPRLTQRDHARADAMS